MLLLGASDRPGFFQIASEQNKILFLDEIGDLSKAGQAKLLRAIEYNEIQVVGDPIPKRLERDVRVIALLTKIFPKKLRKVISDPIYFIA